jgi:hypothetical protein
MLESIPKHNLTKKSKIIIYWNPIKKKDKHLILIDDSDDDNIENNIINYWHQEFQLTKNDEKHS